MVKFVFLFMSFLFLLSSESISASLPSEYIDTGQQNNSQSPGKDTSSTKQKKQSDNAASPKPAPPKEQPSKVAGPAAQSPPSGAVSQSKPKQASPLSVVLKSFQRNAGELEFRNDSDEVIYVTLMRNIMLNGLQGTTPFTTNGVFKTPTGMFSVNGERCDRGNLDKNHVLSIQPRSVIRAIVSQHDKTYSIAPDSGSMFISVDACVQVGNDYHGKQYSFQLPIGN